MCQHPGLINNTWTVGTRVNLSPDDSGGVCSHPVMRAYEVIVNTGWEVVTDVVQSPTVASSLGVFLTFDFSYFFDLVLVSVWLVSHVVSLFRDGKPSPPPLPPSLSLSAHALLLFCYPPSTSCWAAHF